MNRWGPPFFYLNRKLNFQSGSPLLDNFQRPLYRNPQHPRQPRLF